MVVKAGKFAVSQRSQGTGNSRLTECHLLGDVWQQRDAE
jgi:hypothetical protein